MPRINRGMIYLGACLIAEIRVDMPRVLMHFDHYNGLWWVGFLEADCRTSIGPKTRYHRFATLDGLRSFVVRCGPENMPEFERGVRAWSAYVNLTDEQYAKLKR
jgi:hypothetical protein